MVNYQNGKIYKIESLSSGKVYYGSTTQVLSKRMVGHRASSNGAKSKEVIQCGDARIILVENFGCNSKEELQAREADYIRNNDCVNRCIPNRTPKQWRTDNKDRISAISKQYYIDNKDKISAYVKKYRDNNKDKCNAYGKKYRDNNKDKCNAYGKKYREDNRDKANTEAKKYRNDNKDKIYERVLCGCGKYYTKKHKTQHNRSKKHIFYQKTLDFILE
jgi:hypothetical protein